ncbi:pyridoxamine 5'-phosphate oxidase family protein [Streptomyces sp. ICBB 8177]|uniref:pyridoxamine 5'-phosphate oxidase family protein n=1 Tax=Streptomyces sp. ICBB 8177 TaxID=563922 RepID=UPI000D67ADA4|nr:pyridoxamine 5'-phosphate oxidase family protein [Streptomyces sp. ICBB 8177]PWI42547.1 pyridoxamine 5'-phosphate oxidase [Streptomyces sp. ICBB 8177]
MATWKTFEQEAPDLAAEVRARFEAHETHVLATIREDGSPRVSGSEVDFTGGGLTFGSMLNAMKARDLRRDGRCAIHAHPSSDGDAKVAGVAVEVLDPAEKRATATGKEPPGDFHAFRLTLTEAVLTTVDEENQLLVIHLWKPGHPVRVFKRR